MEKSWNVRKEIVHKLWSVFCLFSISVVSRPLLEAKRLCQPQPTPTVQVDSTEDWESEAVSEPFSIVGPEPTEAADAYDIVQAMQEVQVQAHAAPSRLVDTSG